MRFRSSLGCALGIGLFAAFAMPQTAAALSLKECSAKYRAAQGAGTLGGMSWKQFRQAQCGPGAAPAGMGFKASPVFPSAISPKYSKESAGRARMHTCLDQYRANKANNGNGGLRWAAKGGGYYSECNKRLKG